MQLSGKITSAGFHWSDAFDSGQMHEYVISTPNGQKYYFKTTASDAPQGIVDGDTVQINIDRLSTNPDQPVWITGSSLQKVEPTIISVLEGAFSALTARLFRSPRPDISSRWQTAPSTTRPPISDRWSPAELSTAFSDETRRIQASGGQIIPPSPDYFAFLAKEWDMAAPSESTAEILARIGPEFSFGTTEEEFYERREALIQEFVEEPCQDLTRELMDRGMVTTWSNAFNSAPKGVYWFDPSNENQRFFTSVMNGKTYALQDTQVSSLDPNAIVEGYDFSAAMPEGWDASAKLELHA